MGALGGASAAAAAAAAAVVAAASLMPSRYRSDFQELARLGRGGFGVVVAAINRYDGGVHIMSVFTFVTYILYTYDSSCLLIP